MGRKFDLDRFRQRQRLQAHRCSRRQACYRVSVDFDGGPIAEECIFTRQLQFAEQLTVQGVLNEKDLVAQLHQVLLLLVVPVLFALKPFLLYGSRLDHLRTSDDHKSVGWVYRRNDYFWHVAFSATQTLVHVWADGQFTKESLRSAGCRPVELLRVLLFGGHNVAELAGLGGGFKFVCQFAGFFRHGVAAVARRLVRVNEGGLAFRRQGHETSVRRLRIDERGAFFQAKLRLQLSGRSYCEE